MADFFFGPANTIPITSSALELHCVYDEYFELHPPHGTIKCLETSVAVDVDTDVVFVGATTISKPALHQNAVAEFTCPSMFLLL